MYQPGHIIHTCTSDRSVVKLFISNTSNFKNATNFTNFFSLLPVSDPNLQETDLERMMYIYIKANNLVEMSIAIIAQCGPPLSIDSEPHHREMIIAIFHQNTTNNL